ncbi:MAG: hypothetical protein Q9208_008559 [Pyrenodesmia sp. 3 TL-2023]
MASQTYEVEVDFEDDLQRFRTTHFTCDLLVDLPSTPNLREMAFLEKSTDPRPQDNGKEQGRLASFEDALYELSYCLKLRRLVGSTLGLQQHISNLAKGLHIFGYGKEDAAGHPAITSWEKHVGDLIDDIAVLK